MPKPHDPEIADWMGLDTNIEGIILATIEAGDVESHLPA